jgi:DNA polymerase-3 subunit beta
MMEFEIDQTRFLSALALAQTVADKRSTMPVLANALLRATSDGQLVCSTTDLIISLVERVGAEVHGTGGITLGVRHLHDIVRTLPEGMLKIKSLENHWAQIVSGGTEFKLMGMPEGDFPELPEPKGLEFTPVPGHALVDLLQKTQFSISTDEARVNLNGALLECNGKIATMVSTDGHRLTKFVRELSGPALAKGIILPRKGVLELRRVLDRITGDVGVAIGDQHLFVHVDDLTLSVKLTSVTFPPYEQVVPDTHERQIIVGREELLSAFRRAEVMAPEKTATVRVLLQPGKLEITADNPNLGVARQELVVEYDGEALAVGFNARYLIDVLEVMDTDEVRLEFQGELDPVVLKPEGDIDYLGVVMPMRI